MTLTKQDGADRLLQVLYTSFNFKTHYEDSKHKSEICRAAFQASSQCKFKHDCDFAHDIRELRPRVFDFANFKRQKCCNWATGCQYSTRCLYLHDEKSHEIDTGMILLHSQKERKFRIVRDQGDGTVCVFTLHSDGKPKDATGKSVINSLWAFVKGKFTDIKLLPSVKTCCVTCPVKVPKQKRQSTLPENLKKTSAVGKLVPITKQNNSRPEPEFEPKKVSLNMKAANPSHPASAPSTNVPSFYSPEPSPPPLADPCAVIMPAPIQQFTNHRIPPGFPPTATVTTPASSPLHTAMIAHPSASPPTETAHYTSPILSTVHGYSQQGYSQPGYLQPLNLPAAPQVQNMPQVRSMSQNLRKDPNQQNSMQNILNLSSRMSTLDHKAPPYVPGKQWQSTQGYYQNQISPTYNQNPVLITANQSQQRANFAAAYSPYATSVTTSCSPTSSPPFTYRMPTASPPFGPWSPQYAYSLSPPPTMYSTGSYLPTMHSDCQLSTAVTQPVTLPDLPPSGVLMPPAMPIGSAPTPPSQQHTHQQAAPQTNQVWHDQGCVGVVEDGMRGVPPGMPLSPRDVLDPPPLSSIRDNSPPLSPVIVEAPRWEEDQLEHKEESPLRMSPNQSGSDPNVHRERNPSASSARRDQQQNGLRESYISLSPPSRRRQNNCSRSPAGGEQPDRRRRRNSSVLSASPRRGDHPYSPYRGEIDCNSRRQSFSSLNQKLPVPIRQQPIRSPARRNNSLNPEEHKTPERPIKHGVFDPHLVEVHDQKKLLNLLSNYEQALRDQREEVKLLQEENQKLRKKNSGSDQDGKENIGKEDIALNARP